MQLNVCEFKLTTDRIKVVMSSNSPHIRFDWIDRMQQHSILFAQCCRSLNAHNNGCDSMNVERGTCVVWLIILFVRVKCRLHFIGITRMGTFKMIAKWENCHCASITYLSTSCQRSNRRTSHGIQLIIANVATALKCATQLREDQIFMFFVLAKDKTHSHIHTLTSSHIHTPALHTSAGTRGND